MNLCRTEISWRNFSLSAPPSSSPRSIKLWKLLKNMNKCIKMPRSKSLSASKMLNSFFRNWRHKKASRLRKQLNLFMQSKMGRTTTIPPLLWTSVFPIHRRRNELMNPQQCHLLTSRQKTRRETLTRRSTSIMKNLKRTIDPWMSGSRSGSCPIISRTRETFSKPKKGLF